MTTAKEPRTAVKWMIFKRVTGMKWPGDLWDEVKSEAEGRRVLKDQYQSDKLFHLVKVTYTETMK